MAQIGAPISRPTSDSSGADQFVGHRRGGHPGEEQQRVAGQEEPDEQAGLGEQDHPDADQAERLQQALDVERVEGQPVEEGAGLLGAIHDSESDVRCVRAPPRTRAGTGRSSDGAASASAAIRQSRGLLQIEDALVRQLDRAGEHGTAVIGEHDTVGAATPPLRRRSRPTRPTRAGRTGVRTTWRRYATWSVVTSRTGSSSASSSSTDCGCRCTTTFTSGRARYVARCNATSELAAEALATERHDLLRRQPRAAPSEIRTRAKDEGCNRSSHVPEAVTQHSSAPEARADMLPPEPTTRPAATADRPRYANCSRRSPPG